MPAINPFIDQDSNVEGWGVSAVVTQHGNPGFTGNPNVNIVNPVGVVGKSVPQMNSTENTALYVAFVATMAFVAIWFLRANKFRFVVAAG